MCRRVYGFTILIVIVSWPIGSIRIPYLLFITLNWFFAIENWNISIYHHNIPAISFQLFYSYPENVNNFTNNDTI